MPSREERRARKEADNLAAVLDKIPQMFGDKAAVGMRMHELIMAAAPQLQPRLWYGMPGYAKSASKPVLVFMRMDDYVTFGVTEKASFAQQRAAGDSMAANAWYIFELDEATEAALTEIVRWAVG